MTETICTDVIRKGSAEEIVAHRDRAVELYKQGFEFIAMAFEAHKRAAPSAYFPNALRQHEPMPDRLPSVTRELDSDTWSYLIEASGLRNFMDAAELAKFREQVEKAPPEVTVDNLLATFSDLKEQRGDIFRRGVVNLFKHLTPRKISNDAFRLGKKIVLEYAVGSFGVNYGWRGDQISDLDRIFHILDGKEPKDHLGDARAMINQAARVSPGRSLTDAVPGELETDYFRFRWYKNQSLHVMFKRPDLVAKANRIVADHYGEVLPDGRRGKAA